VSASPRIPFSLLLCSPRVLALPDHALRATAAPVDVDRLSKDTRAHLADGLVAALFGDRPGSGLAAPMCGIGLRIVVALVDDRTLVMANPVIDARSSATTVEQEGNLCLPGVTADVARSETIGVTWQDLLSGREHTGTFSGWAARVLQHEIEILDGTMFLDHAEGQPLGNVEKPEDQAARSVAEIFGEEKPARSLAEPLAVATFDADVAGLPGSVVRRECAPVDFDALDPALIRRLAEGLLRTQFDRNGVGLAAPQVGLNLRMAAIDDRDGDVMLLLNPEIVDRSDEQVVMVEGCLTIPGWRGDVPRPDAIRLRNHTPTGEVVERDVSGYLARVVQHEMDHLDGVLYTDRMDPDSPLTPSTGPARADTAIRAAHAEARRAPGRRRPSSR
jgi:peptide deformylase